MTNFPRYNILLLLKIIWALIVLERELVNEQGLIETLLSKREQISLATQVYMACRRVSRCSQGTLLLGIDLFKI
ncbi:hypothetical protein Mgra_00007114 [Meloidogyne graminicola]|uniref:Secreted protein n=1 Tax=Meloidogyne graminicola TaxID=189291 RepID=A0A8S9ZJE9_9BILA|nr:hypothetical protein Mgra_00007114 [Meloidogyne graminicola]